MKLFYALISTNEEKQLDSYFKVCKADKYLYDVMDSTQDQRMNFTHLFDYLNKADELICFELTHFCMNNDELIQVLNQCYQKNIIFTIASDNLTLKKQDLSLFIYALENSRNLERQFHLTRQKEGILQAAEKGIFAGRPKIDLQEHLKLYEKWKKGEITAVQAAKKMNLSRATFYRRMNEFEELLKNKKIQ